jgi:hypothetical protein
LNRVIALILPSESTAWPFLPASFLANLIAIPVYLKFAEVVVYFLDESGRAKRRGDHDPTGGAPEAAGQGPRAEPGGTGRVEPDG